MSCVTADMIQTFEVSRRCKQSIPCKHDCKITLKDGRMIDSLLDAREICRLLQDIDLAQAQCHVLSRSHFSNQVSDSKKDQSPVVTSTKILSELFKTLIFQQKLAFTLPYLAA